MKSYKLLALVSFIFASKVSAECFSEKLGFPCCTATTDVVLTNENGKFGFENNQYCGLEASSASKEDILLTNTYKKIDENNKMEVSLNNDENEENEVVVTAAAGNEEYGEDDADLYTTITVYEEVTVTAEVEPEDENTNTNDNTEVDNNTNIDVEEDVDADVNANTNIDVNADTNANANASADIDIGVNVDTDAKASVDATINTNNDANNDPYSDPNVNDNPYSAIVDANNDIDVNETDVDVDVNVDIDADNEDSVSDDEEDIKLFTSEYMDKLIVSENCPDVAFNAQDDITYGTLKKITYYSENTKSERPMNILLPPNYDENKKYPVLYLLHGILSDQDSLIKPKYSTPNISGYLMSKGMAKEMIIVFPYTYAPKDGVEVEPGFTKEHFQGYDNFINELIYNIMPFMEKNYPILTGRDNTAIAGFSMGGRNSLYIGYSKPDMFGYIGAFSPAPGVLPDESNYGLLTPETFKTMDKQYAPYVTLVCTGSEDDVVKDYPLTYHNTLVANGEPHIWYVVPGGGHDGVTVSSGVYNFIQTLFGNLKPN